MTDGDWWALAGLTFVVAGLIVWAACALDDLLIGRADRDHPEPPSRLDRLDGHATDELWP